MSKAVNSQDLFDSSDPEFRHLIGKTVTFMCKGKTRQGLVEFIGVNDLHGKFQVTINRMPCWPVIRSTIKEIPTPPRILMEMEQKPKK